MLTSIPTHAARRAASRPFSFLFAAAAVAGAALLASACGGGGKTTTEPLPEDCEGGYVTPEGKCEGKCTPDKCLADNACVGNRCQLKCDSHKDCYLDGSQECLAAAEDDTGAAIFTCQSAGRPAGFGVSCPFAEQCANWLACPDDGVCFATQCADAANPGGNPAACVQDADYCKDDPSCVVGKCPDGSGCRVNCATDCKPWLECQTFGAADAEAYCTTRDCAADADCGAGFYCGIIRDPHEVCGSSPAKGNNNFCGTTTGACLSPGANGTSLFEGSMCMLRKSCLKRDQDVPCQSDLDCSQVDNQKCVSYAGETRCAHTCAGPKDCLPDHACDPAVGACVPKFTSWISDDMGSKFCEPCKNDEDCGSAGSTWACSELSGGARACFDQTFPDTCETNADCPKSPSGKNGTCLNDAAGYDASSSVYKRCYFPLNLNTYKTSCW